MHWDDIRIVRAVYQAGSYAGAARRLGVNPTTVPRRLARLEKRLGVTLFEAVDGLRRPTDACERIIVLSETMARQAEKIADLGDDVSPELERRRIAATDSVSAYLLAPRLAEFLGQHPDISLEFSVSTENVDFSRWEADIAIRLQRPEKGDFVVSKLMDFELFLIEPADGTKFDGGIVCAYPDALSGTPESRFLANTGLSRRARCLSKNVVLLKALIQQGGTGILPGYMCAELLTDRRFRLSRLSERRSAWLLVQSHLRNDQTTRRVIDWIRSCAAAAASGTAPIASL